jgi:aconitate hydratase 2/2-methylisocitrate dehydratase
MLESYRKHVAERAALGIPPLPLDAKQTSELCELLKNPPKGQEEILLHLLSDRVSPGVDPAAYVKAGFLTAIAKKEITSPLISRIEAVELLGTMIGGYNVQSLIDLLQFPTVSVSDSSETPLVMGGQGKEPIAAYAANALSKILLVYDAFHDVLELSKTNPFAKLVINSWAEAEWFTVRPTVREAITVTVFKVPGETNTDDLSPAQSATTRPDIPLHALVMLESRQPGSLATIAELKKKGHPVAYVGDVVGTGSSRKSAINSVLWHTGNDIPFVPNKRAGGYVLGGAIAPIFFNTAEDAGALPIQCDVTQLETGMVITIHPYKGEITNEAGEVISTFALKPDTILDEVRAGGRIPLLIGRTLTDKTRLALGLEPSTIFTRPQQAFDTGKGYTLAQKMVGKACGLPGVRPRHILRTHHHHRRFSRYHRPHDPRRIKRTRLSWFQCRLSYPKFLPHSRLSQTSRHQNPSRTPRLLCFSWRCRPPSR